MQEVDKEKSGTEGYGRHHQHDKDLSKRIVDLIQKNDHEISDILENFPLYVRRYNMTRFLAHYEIFRMIKDIPGDIVECGVFRGTSFLSFAKFTEIFSMGNKIKKLIGFDNFQGFREVSEEDGKQSDAIKIGAWDPSKFKEELYEMIDIFTNDSFAPWVPRISIVEGDIFESVPKYVEENPGLRISLLHLDCDLYKPTFSALKHLYPLVLTGGIVILDEYAMHQWPGESKAVEDFFGINKIPKMRSFSWSGSPTAYFIKGADDKF